MKKGFVRRPKNSLHLKRQDVCITEGIDFFFFSSTNSSKVLHTKRHTEGLIWSWVYYKYIWYCAIYCPDSPIFQVSWFFILLATLWYREEGSDCRWPVPHNELNFNTHKPVKSCCGYPSLLLFPPTHFKFPLGVRDLAQYITATVRVKGKCQILHQMKRMSPKKDCPFFFVARLLLFPHRVHDVYLPWF